MCVFCCCFSLSLAGKLNIYLDTDLAPRWNASVKANPLKNTDFILSTKQKIALGIGAEYTDVIIDKLSYVAGGKYQFKRSFDTDSKTDYQMHLIYAQLLNDLDLSFLPDGQKLAAGIELNYSIQQGYKDSNFEDIKGGLGYALFLAYNIDDILLKAGYRSVNGQISTKKNGANADKDNAYNFSNGFFIQAGYQFDLPF